MEASLTLVILAVIVGGTAFWLWALRDAMRAGHAVWVTVIAVTHFFGALAYVLVGRERP